MGSGRGRGGVAREVPLSSTAATAVWLGNPRKARLLGNGDQEIRACHAPVHGRCAWGAMQSCSFCCNALYCNQVLMAHIRFTVMLQVVKCGRGGRATSPNSPGIITLPHLHTWVYSTLHWAWAACRRLQCAELQRPCAPGFYTAARWYTARYTPLGKLSSMHM